MYDDFMKIHEEAGLIRGLIMNFAVDFLFQAILLLFYWWLYLSSYIILVCQTYDA